MDKKKTATITFHASHNYGSMLQAYALQQTLLGLGVDNEIINLRTDVQKSCYPDPSISKTLKQRIKKLLGMIIVPNYIDSLNKKYELFENFLRDYLILTPEYRYEADLKELSQKYDYYITGSDQCWNTTCFDFDWSYFLTFTNSDNKIAYASSFGPVTENIAFDIIKNFVGKFKTLSAREDGTAKVLEAMIGKEVPILPDPTLLLGQDQWRKMAGEKPLIELPYIFLYTPHKKEKLILLAKHLSEILNLPVVISNISDIKGEFIMNFWGQKFEYKLDVGPKEFLNLIANAELVLSGSYHAILFSIIFQRPFFAYNGDKDNRMKRVLSLYGLEDRSIDGQNYLSKIPEAFLLNYEGTEIIIFEQQNKALDYLKKSLEFN